MTVCAAGSGFEDVGEVVVVGGWLVVIAMDLVAQAGMKGTWSSRPAGGPNERRKQAAVEVMAVEVAVLEADFVIEAEGCDFEGVGSSLPSPPSLPSGTIGGGNTPGGRGTPGGGMNATPPGPITHGKGKGVPFEVVVVVIVVVKVSVENSVRVVGMNVSVTVCPEASVSVMMV